MMRNLYIQNLFLLDKSFELFKTFSFLKICYTKIMKELIKEKWTEKEYLEYLEYLKSLKEEKYKEFHSKLTTTKYEILGIRVPLQRKIAKSISKGNVESFLGCSKNHYYEEVMIKGFVLGEIKDKEVLLKYLDTYVSLIDNWAINDGFCNSLKIVNQDKEFWFSYFSDYLKSKEEFRVRVGLIVFLSFYVEEDYLKLIFKLVDQIELDKYYVNMGIAWLLCECFTKYRNQTLDYFKKSKINIFTFNKTISKIRDSYRVSKEDKEYLANLRRKEIKK